MRGQNDLRSMEKGVNWIENLGENRYKMLQNSEIVHFDEKFRPSLGPSLSGTKHDRDKLIFPQKEGVNEIMLMHKLGTQSERNSQTRGSSPENLSTMSKYGSTLLGTCLYHWLLLKWCLVCTKTNPLFHNWFINPWK